MQFNVTSVPTTAGQMPRGAEPSAVDLLRMILETQREQLELLKTAHKEQMEMHKSVQASLEGQKRKSWFERWLPEFPDLPEAARAAMPILERAYLSLMSRAVEEARDNAGDILESDYSLRDFVDRYGMQMAQFGQIIMSVSPWAEVNPPQEEKS